MNRERQLERRLQTLHALSEAVSAMQALSAHHFRLSRKQLPAARTYRDEIEQAIDEIGFSFYGEVERPVAQLLLASDLGLCGDYNSRLVEKVLDYRGAAGAAGAGLLFCVGRRPRSLLGKHGIHPDRCYQAPTSVEGMPRLLLQLAEDVLQDYLGGHIGGLLVVSARFEGAGHFSPVLTPVLPIESKGSNVPLRKTGYQSLRRLADVAAREFLYMTLYELLLDALASEHGMRLVATEAARQWLDDTRTSVRRSLVSCRRETATQEVLDIAAGSRTAETRKSERFSA